MKFGFQKYCDFFLLFVFCNLPIYATPTQAIQLEKCSILIQLNSDLKPVEIQSDSFLAYDEINHCYVALLCTENQYRTFKPPTIPAGSQIQLTLLIQNKESLTPTEFQAIQYFRENHPIRKATSLNQFVATRQNQFYVMSYTDIRNLPRINRSEKSDKKNIDFKEQNQNLIVALDSFNKRLILSEGSQPAINEESYYRRLFVTVMIAAILLLLLIGAIIKLKKNDRL